MRCQVVASEAPEKELAQGARLLFVPEDVEAVIRPRVGTVYGTYSGTLALEGVGKREFGLHPHTVEQEIKTLVNRHLQKTPEPKCGSTAWRLMVMNLRRLSRSVGPCRKTPIKQVLRGKTGRARHRFLQGCEEVRKFGLQPWHARVSCMQKQELHEVSKLVGKEDRAIQYRSTAFNSELVRFLWQIEHRTFHATKHEGFRWCAKGLTKKQRAILLLQMADSFETPIFVCADHSRFDAHVNLELLKEEHRYYNRLHGWDPHLRKLLKLQCHNRGKTVGGVEYECDGKRMSGDINTALGNSILNYGMLSAWLESGGVRGCILLDGDDSVIVLDKAQLSALPPIGEFMLNFGMVTEASIVEDVRRAEFCQSKIVLGREGPYFCPDIRKLLDTTRKSAANVPGNQWKPILRASILCELISNPSMPMMKPLARWLEANPGAVRIPDWLRYRIKSGYGVGEEQLVAAPWTEPTVDERISFGLAWDISPSEQIAFEDHVSFHAFPSGGKIRYREREGQPPPIPMPDEIMWEDDPARADDDDLSSYSWEAANADWQRRWTNLLTK